MFVLKNGQNGWRIEFCVPTNPGSKYYNTAEMRWRSKSEYLQPNFIHDNFDKAREACDILNSVKKKG